MQDPFDQHEELLEKAETAANHSTNAKVAIGAAVLTDTGEIYSGTIVETKDRHQSIHAERLAVFKAISEGANVITSIAVYVDKPTPRICGSCLQVIYEFSGGNDVPIFTKNILGEVEEHSLSDLYPHPWLPKDIMFPRQSE